MNVECLAQTLALRGIGKGATVGIYGANSPEWSQAMHVSIGRLRGLEPSTAKEPVCELAVRVAILLLLGAFHSARENETLVQEVLDPVIN